MKTRIQRAFDDIGADRDLVEKTTAYLKEKRGRPQKHSVAWSRRLAGAFAVAALALMLVGGNMYFTVSAYVSIDVNPSVELSLNRWGRVVDATAFNPEGHQLLAETTVKGKKYHQAAALLVGAIDARGYLAESALVAVTVQTDDSREEQILCDALRQSVHAQVQAALSAAEVEVFPVTAEIRANAHGCHMSPAKYLAIQELLSVDEDATLEQYNQSDISQIRQRTRQCIQEHGGAASGGSPGHHGGGRHGGW